MLLAAMNPCPCGSCGDPTHPCTCNAAMVTRYQYLIELAEVSSTIKRYLRWRRRVLLASSAQK
jgi:predicted ATPase with chaperone activity